MNEYLVFLFVTNIISFFIANHYASKRSYKTGYLLGVADERMLFSVAIARAFPDCKKETLEKIGLEYKQATFEFEQELKNQSGARL